MKNESNRKMSKVAVCPKCDSFVMACHIDYLDRKNEKDFTRLSNEGFIIKIETAQETRDREFRCFEEYEDCKNGKCN